MIVSAFLDCAGKFAGCATLALAVALAMPARAQMPPVESAAEFCLTVNRDLTLGVPLRRTAARLRSGEPLKVVAIGSSTTRGLWMLNSAATYPEVMRRELEKFRPNARIEVVNSGRVGETILDNTARFERDVFAHRPDLVIWQLGTNDVAWGAALTG